MLEWPERVPAIIYLSPFAAAAGGLVCHLYACKKGRVRNNYHCRKAAIEIVGGTLVGFFLSLGASLAGMPDTGRLLTAFVGGSAWALILEAMRKKATDIVNAALFGTPPPNNQEED